MLKSGDGAAIQGGVMPRETASGRQARLLLYRSFTESGQTMTDFARERGTTYWKVKSAVKKSELEAGGRSSALFQEVALPASADVGGGEYAVMLKNGRELRIPAHFTEKRVRQLVEILETC